jgi:hypothetical protein
MEINYTTPVIFALAFGLHGCFLQKKIAEDMQAHSVLVDSILSDFEAAKIAVELPDVLDRVAGEYRATAGEYGTAGDTAAINTLLASFALSEIQGAKEIDTGRQIIRIRAKERDGRTVIDLEAFAKPSGTSQAASIRKPANFAPQSNETKTPLQILLLIIAALGAAAKALETWLNK